MRRQGTQRGGQKRPGDTTKQADSGSVRDGYAVEALRSVIVNPDASATARAAAARTLAEIDGLIGRHSQAPVDRAVSLPIAVLSRPELERELARLRSACAVDTVSPVA